MNDRWLHTEDVTNHRTDKIGGWVLAQGQVFDWNNVIIEHDSMFVLALFLGLPRFRSSVYVLQFTLSMIHGSRRGLKNGEGLGTLIMWMTSIGCGVDIYVGGAVSDYKYVRNKPKSEFLTGQVEYSPSCERLGSCLATECLMRKSSMCTLFLNVDASPLRPPCVHLTSFTWQVFPGFPCFSPLFHFCVPVNKA